MKGTEKAFISSFIAILLILLLGLGFMLDQSDRALSACKSALHTSCMTNNYQSNMINLWTAEYNTTQLPYLDCESIK